MVIWKVTCVVLVSLLFNAALPQAEEIGLRKYILIKTDHFNPKKSGVRGWNQFITLLKAGHFDCVEVKCV